LSTKNVKIPVYLEEKFEKLANRDAWGPGAFPSFVREAVRWYLNEQERLAKFGVSGVPEEADQRQAGAPPGKPSRRK
jgi:hypothetical protein